MNRHGKQALDQVTVTVVIEPDAGEAALRRPGERAAVTENRPQNLKAVPMVYVKALGVVDSPGVDYKVTDEQGRAVAIEGTNTLWVANSLALAPEP
jgi:hypothetical protein